MMSGAVLRAWKTVKDHVPLIKFRKGGPYRTSSPAAGTVSDTRSQPPAASAPSRGQTGTVIEDWQLPPNYRRAPLDDKEIDAINSGGAF